MTHLRRAFATLLLSAAAIATAAASASAVDRIDTVAGSANGGFAGDGGFAASALLTSPSDVAPLGTGGAYLIADSSNNRVRRVDAAGAISTVAGAGPCCGTVEPYAGAGIAATDPGVRFNQPRGISPLADGGFLIADTGNNRIRRVSAAGTVTNVAGNGIAGYGTGDGATTVSLRAPRGVAALPDGGFLIADTGNNRIARVLSSGLLVNVVGNPSTIALGDGGPATAAGVNAPSRVVPLSGGGFLIADTGNNRIRRVGADGTIATVAGSAGPAGFGGDGGLATAASLSAPEGVAVREDGSIAIADTGNERIREVATDGRIRTIAGTGTLGFSGDGGLPTAAQLSHPRAVALDATRLWIADSFNHRVRAITVAPAQGRDPDPDPPPLRRPVVDPEPPTTVPPGVSPPLLGVSSVLTPLSGIVRVRLPGRRGFSVLVLATNIPLGSEIDATRGRVSLLFKTTASGRTASAIVSEGRVIVRQPRRLDLGQRPGQLVLSGPLAGCRDASRERAARLRRARGSSAAGSGARAAGPRAAAAGSKRGKRGRRAKVHAEGRIEVRGRYGAAIVRGTRWTTVDRCPADPRPGTLFAVAEGRVLVTAFALRRRTLVTRGRRLLAPPRRPLR